MTLQNAYMHDSFDGNLIEEMAKRIVAMFLFFQVSPSKEKS